MMGGLAIARVRYTARWRGLALGVINPRSANSISPHSAMMGGLAIALAGLLLFSPARHIAALAAVLAGAALLALLGLLTTATISPGAGKRR